MKYLVSLNGKQYEVIVEHHTANVTNVTPFVSERSPKESSIEQKQAEHLGSLGNPPANSTAVKAPLPGTITKLNHLIIQIYLKKVCIKLLKMVKI